MKTRIITSIFIVAVLVAVLFLSSTIVYPIALSLLALTAIYEVLSVFGLKNRLFIAIPAYLIMLAMPVGAYFMSKANKAFEFYLSLFLVLFGYMLYLFIVMILERGRMKFSEFAGSFTMVIYLAVAFSSLSLIRYIDGVGLYCLGTIFVAAWMTDVCAYFVGRFFGKHKLIPEVSPKKTVEGAVGGWLLSIGFMVLYGFLSSVFSKLITGIELKPNYLILALMGAVLSVLAQGGDLFASVVKREYGIKDYGNVLPGHGGIMDRFDSIIAISAAATIMCLFVPPFA